MKIGIIIQARMGSQRLPGKVLRPIGGSCILDILLKRIKDVGLPIVVATTDQKSDNTIVEYLNRRNCMYYRGSEDDVLSRYYFCSVKYGFEHIIRLTADNPFVDSTLIRDSLDMYCNTGEDKYLYTDKYPIGIGLEVFSFKQLARAFIEASGPKEREHVTPYISNNPLVKINILSYPVNKEHIRLTVDAENDFKLVERLITDFNAANLTIDQIIQLLDKHPELIAINSNIKQKKWNE